MHLIVYFDYTCPYSYHAAVWLPRVTAVEHDLTIEWRPFVVKEVNRPEGEGAPLWEQEAAVHTRTGLAFLAGEAAARQGGDAADRFRSLLQAAFHAQHLDIREPGVLEGLAHEARLDVARFEGDRRNTRLLSEVGRSHRDAVASYGVFGTPTLVFPNGRAAYTKLADAPLETAAPHLFEHLRELVGQHHVLQEIKLTQPEGA
jgi:2-hydroxychromene-2-carboxylate isomerase